MMHERELQIIYWEAYRKAGIGPSNGKHNPPRPTRHGSGLRAVWDAAIAWAAAQPHTASSAELFEALGMSKDRSAQEGTRLDRIAMGGLQVVEQSAGDNPT